MSFQLTTSKVFQEEAQEEEANFNLAKVKGDYKLVWFDQSIENNDFQDMLYTLREDHDYTINGFR